MAFKPKVLILAMLAMGGMLVATACGGQSSESDKPLLGIVSISANEANNARFITGAKQEAKAQGWEVSVVDANGSADQANAAMRTFAQRDAGAIIDMVFPVSSIGAGLAATNQAKVPVATWGGGLGNGVVATDGAGGPLAVPIVEKMVKDMDGKGSVLALTYHAGLVCRQREQEFDKILAKHQGIEVTKNEVHIPGFIQDGSQYTTAWLSSHQDESGDLAIWGCWDDPAIGAISALKQRHMEDVKVYGQNGNADAINAVKDGWMTATNWQNSTEEGKQLVKTLAKASDAGSNWKPKNVTVPGVVVDKSNVKEFLQKHPDADK